jgi:hypothetical protein
MFLLFCSSFTSDGSAQIVIATTVNLLVYSIKISGSDKGKEKATLNTVLELIKTVERPALPGNFAGSNFRSARFHPSDPTVLYTVVNTVPPRTRTKSSPRTAFVVRWDTEKWAPVKIRKIGDKGATCFDVRFICDGSFSDQGCSWTTVSVRTAHISLMDPRTLVLASLMRPHLQYAVDLGFPSIVMLIQSFFSLFFAAAVNNTERA